MPRVTSREENFVEEIFSLATVSPDIPRSSDCNFYRSRASIRTPSVQRIYHARPVSPICIPMSRIDVSDCRLTSSPPLVAIFSRLFLFFFFFPAISRQLDVDSIRIAQRLQIALLSRYRITSVSNKRFLDLYLISP